MSGRPRATMVALLMVALLGLGGGVGAAPAHAQGGAAARLAAELARAAGNSADSAVRSGPRLADRSVRVLARRPLFVPEPEVPTFGQRVNRAVVDIFAPHIQGLERRHAKAVIKVGCVVNDLWEVYQKPTSEEQIEAALVNFGGHRMLGHQVQNLVEDLGRAESSVDAAQQFAVFYGCQRFG